MWQLICLHKVKWFQVLLFSMSNFIHLVFLSNLILIICLNSSIWLIDEVLPLWIIVNLGVMAMKKFSTLSKASELEPCHQMVKCCVQDTCWRSLTTLQRCSQYILQSQLTGLGISRFFLVKQQRKTLNLNYLYSA